MAVVNRDLDPSQQRLNWLNVAGTQSVVGVSAILALGIAPCAMQVLAVAVEASGLSGAPTAGIQIQRFVVGSGLTTILVNGSSLLTVQAYSTSGAQAMVLPASGSTLVQLLRGDQLQMITSTANTAASYVVEAVVQVLQDVKSDFGL
jgi:hypothetical protein